MALVATISAAMSHAKKLLLLAIAALGCATGSPDEPDQKMMSYEEAASVCRAFCEDDAALCGESVLPRCYETCIATYEHRAGLRTPPYLRFNEGGYCVDEMMWAHFGCPVSLGCVGEGDPCSEAFDVLHRCEAAFEADTEAWCDENCPEGCNADYGSASAYGRACWVRCESDTECPDGSHCGRESGRCTAECEWRRADDGVLVPVFCEPGQSCDGIGCCVGGGQRPYESPCN